VTNLDNLTIQVVTPEIYAPFLENFGAGVPILPRHVLAKTVADKTFVSAYGVNWKPEDIVGSGPFCIKEYKPAQYVLLERNPYFLRGGQKGPAPAVFRQHHLHRRAGHERDVAAVFERRKRRGRFHFPLRIRPFQRRVGQGPVQPARTRHRPGNRLFLVQRKHQRRIPKPASRWWIPKN
jgi:hypothetical protein